MDDRYYSQRYQPRDTGYGSHGNHGRLQYDSAVSGGGHLGSRHVGHQGNRTASTSTLRSLSAQLQGMISETNTLKNTSHSLAAPRGYSPMPPANSAQAGGARSYQSSVLSADSRHSVPTRPPSLPSSERLYREPVVTAEERPTSSVQVASLLEQVKLHKQTIDSLITDKTNLEQSVAKLELLLSEKEGECALSVQSVEQVSRQREDLVASYTELERKCQQHAQVISEKDADISKLTAAMQLVKQSCDVLAGEKEELLTQSQSSAKAYADSQAAHELLQRKLEAAEAQAGELATERDSTTQYTDLFREKLTQQVSALSEEIASLNHQLEQKDIASEQLNLQLAELQGTEAERSAAHEHRIQQVTDRLMEEKQALQVELNTEMEKNRQMHQRIVAQQDRTNDLENQLSSFGSQSSTELRSLRQELSSERDRNQEAGRDKDTIRKQLQDLHKQYIALAEEHQVLKQQVSSLEDDNKSLSMSLHEKTALHRQIQAETLQVQERLDAVSRENLTLREHVQHMHQVASGHSENGSSTQLSNGVADEDQDIKQNQALSLALQKLQAERDHILSEFHRHSHAYQQHIAGLRKQLARHQEEGSSSADDGGDTGNEEPVVENGDHVSNGGGTCASCVQLTQALELQQTTLVEMQSRFAEALSEKAELVQSLQSMEHRILQLEMETDTIGEYVSVYRSQREELLSQFGEKRKLINWLQTERSNVVLILHELNDYAQRGMAPFHNGSEANSLANGHPQDGHAVLANSAAMPLSGHDQATADVMKKLVDVIFYLCQGDPTSVKDSRKQEAAMPAHALPGQQSSPKEHSASPPRVVSPNSPVASAENFRVPRAAVHSDIYSI